MKLDLCERERYLSDANEEITKLEEERNNLRKALKEKKSLADSANVDEIGRMRGEIEVLKERLNAALERENDVEVTNKDHLLCLQLKLREGEAERRKMHNIIQELRGNIRVVARIRPFLPSDSVPNDAEASIKVAGEQHLTIENDTVEHKFSFNKVFGPSVNQETVFDEVSEFIQSALDGYNVCLFSYGQTGSGKTHTMQGSGTDQMRGIIPRAIELIGRQKMSLESDGWAYTIKASFLEIYNECIRDLLRDNNGAVQKNHDIKIDRNGQRYVSNLTLKTIDPCDHDEVDALLRQASSRRSVAATGMNEMSSRSHSVFTLHLEAANPRQKQQLKGVLHLVDLAGSERLARSGVSGQRMTEAVAINRSLSSLTDVFVAISNKQKHIPFRNSKLTYLLQPSLIGNGKTLMLVNLSPTIASSQETLCSLRFASQVNQCELGRAKRSFANATSDALNKSGKSSTVTTSTH